MVGFKENPKPFLAPRHTLWKKRPVWGARPDDTWGLFLEHVDDILKPYCQGLALLPEQERLPWTKDQFLCEGMVSHLVVHLGKGAPSPDVFFSGQSSELAKNQGL